MGDCREYIEKCIFNNERIPWSGEYSREYVLEQLQALGEVSGMSDAQLIREEGIEQEMIWMLQKGEKIEKGMYSCNRPDEDVLVCAPAALMALILGEYKLAQKICERDSRNWIEDTAFEVLQDDTGPHLKGSQYRFCEACILSFDMEKEVTAYFKEKGVFEFQLYTDTETKFFAKVYIHGDEKQIWKFLYIVLKRMKQQVDVCETFHGMRFLVIYFAVLRKVDETNENFWKDIYELFSESEQCDELTDFIHQRWLEDAWRGTLPNKDKLNAVINAHFQHRDYLTVDGEVGKYVTYIIRQMCKGKKTEYRNLCRQYFSVVKRFGGRESKKWDKLVIDLFNTKDFLLIDLGFRNHLLDEELIADYIDYFLNQKDCSWIVSYLIQKKWLMKERV